MATTHEEEMLEFLESIDSRLETLNNTVEKVIGKEFIDAFKKYSKEQVDAIKQNSNTRSRPVNANDMSSNAAANNLNRELNNRFRNISGSFGRLTERTNDLARSIGNAREGLTSMAQSLRAIPVLGGILTSTLGLLISEGIENTINSFQRLSKSGISMGEAFLSVQISASKAGMSIDDFTSVIVENSKAIQQYGIESFAELAKTVRQSSNALYEMGLSAGDQTRYLAKYLDAQKARGLLDKMNESDVRKGFVQNTQVLAEFSKKTGTSLEKLLDSFTEASNNVDIFTASSFIGNPDARNRFIQNYSMAQNTSPALAQMLPDIANPQRRYKNDSFRLLSGLFPQLAQTMVGAGTGEMDYADMMTQFSQYVRAHPEIMKQLDQLVAGGRSGATELRSMFFEAQQFTPEQLQRVKESNEFERRLASLSKLIDQVSSGFRELWYNFLEAFLEALTGTDMTKSIENVKELMGTLGGQIGGMVKDLFAWLARPSTQEAIKSAFETLGKVAGFIGDMFVASPSGFIAGAFVAGITALFASSFVIGALKTAITGLFGTMVGSIGRGTTGATGPMTGTGPLNGKLARGVKGVGGGLIIGILGSYLDNLSTQLDAEGKQVEAKMTHVGSQVANVAQLAMIGFGIAGPWGAAAGGLLGILLEFGGDVYTGLSEFVTKMNDNAEQIQRKTVESTTAFRQTLGLTQSQSDMIANQGNAAAVGDLTQIQTRSAQADMDTLLSGLSPRHKALVTGLINNLKTGSDSDIAAIANNVYETLQGDPDMDIVRQVLNADQKDKLNNLLGMQAFGQGGIARTASIFGEKGPEAAIPLDSGQRIPIADINLTGLGSTLTQLAQELAALRNTVKQIATDQKNIFLGVLENTSKISQNTDSTARNTRNFDY